MLSSRPPTAPEPVEGGRGGGRRRAVVAAAAATVALAVLVAAVLVGRGGGEDDGPAVAPTSAPTRPPADRAAPPAPLLPVTAGASTLATPDDLARVADLAAAGTEPWASAVTTLVEEADEARDRRPSPRNPLEIEETTGDFVDDSADAYTLALAYALTGEDGYADAAAGFVMAWAETATETRDTCVHDGSCNTSLVIGRVAPAFVFAVELVESSGTMAPEQVATFRRWLADVLLPAASQRTNNWGDAGTFFRIAATAHLGDAEGFSAAVATWKAQADLIETDGEIPEETRRGRKGLQYSQEALLYKVASAKIAERQGVDLWTYVGAGGGSLEAALDLVSASFQDPLSWRWHDGVDVPSPAPMWEIAAARWDKPAYRSLAARRRPFGPQGHSAIRWTTLAGGVTSD